MLWLTVAVLALGAAGCNSGGSAGGADAGANNSAEGLENVAAAGENTVANAGAAGNLAEGSGAPPPPCQFNPGDMKDWKAVRGKDGTPTAGMIVVTGKARTGDPRYEARLTKTRVGDEVLRLRLARVERHDTDNVPADGWYELRYGPGEKGIGNVFVVVCPEEASVAELGVEESE
jgi:hypothetical protein